MSRISISNARGCSPMMVSNMVETNQIYSTFFLIKIKEIMYEFHNLQSHLACLHTKMSTLIRHTIGESLMEIQ